MGFSLRQFYCCGKLKSVTLSFALGTKEKCGKGDGDGCCKNKHQFFKVKDKHISPDKVSNPFNYITDLYFYNPSSPITTFSVQETALAYSSHAPPSHTDVPLYIYNCFFRI